MGSRHGLVHGVKDKPAYASMVDTAFCIALLSGLGGSQSSAKQWPIHSPTSAQCMAHRTTCALRSACASKHFRCFSHCMHAFQPKACAKGLRQNHKHWQRPAPCFAYSQQLQFLASHSSPQLTPCSSAGVDAVAVSSGRQLIAAEAKIARIVLLPDLHGDFDQALHALRLAHVVGSHGQWSANSTVLVQVSTAAS